MKTRSGNRLSTEDKKFAKWFSHYIQFHTHIEMAVKSAVLVETFKNDKTVKKHFPNLVMNKGKLRDVINYCRANGMVKNLIAGNQGYWIENDIRVLNRYGKTLLSRIKEIGKILPSIQTDFDHQQEMFK